MIDWDRWPRKARQRSRTKGANGSEQTQSVSSFHIKEDEAGFASKHKYDKFEKNSDMSFRFPRHRVRDLNFQDGSKGVVQLCLVHACLHIILQDGLQLHRKQYVFFYVFAHHATD